MRLGTADAGRGHSYRDALAWLALAVLGTWLAWPVLFAVHVEGFSASIVALGTHLANGTMNAFSPSQPFNTEYFTLTKLGAVLGIAGLERAFGLGGADAMRVLMWGGFALCVAGSAALIRRWSGAPWAIVCAVLLLMPGLFESAFFFNDNVPGAGLMIAALALFRAEREPARWQVTGVLIGLGVAVRIDMVLVCTAIPLIALETQGWRRGMVATAAVGAVAVAVVFIMFAFVGATPFDAVRAGAIAVDLWQRPGSLFYQFVLMIPFCGVAGLLLVLLGIGGAVRSGGRMRTLLLFGVPLLVNLALIGKVWEVRQLLVLTPFFGTLAALGIVRLVADFRAGNRIVPVTVAALAAAAMVAPPTWLYMKDGPRAVVGRIGGIAIWRSWQTEVDRDFATISTLVPRELAPGTVSILTDQWDEDRYLHLVLVDSGVTFIRSPRDSACAYVASVAAAPVTVQHITVQQSFVPYWQDIQADRLHTLVSRCLARAFAPQRIFLLARADRMAIFFGKGDVIGSRTVDPRLTAVGYAPIVGMELDAARLARLETVYRRNSTADPHQTVVSGMAATRARTDLFR